MNPNTELSTESQDLSRVSADAPNARPGLGVLHPSAPS